MSHLPLDLIEGFGDAFYAVDPQWTITHINQAAEAFFERDRAEFLGKVLWHALPKLTGSRFEQPIRRALAAQTAEEICDWSVTRPTRFIQVRAFAFSSGLGITFRDITAQQAADAKLRRSEERQRLAMDAAALGDWSWDARSDLVTFSDQAAAIFEIPAGPRMTWTQMGSLLHPDDVERTRAAVTRSIASRTPYRTEYRVRSAALGWRWIASLGSATYDASGQVAGMIGVVQDISDRKQAEAERELAAERLTRAHRAARAAAWEWDLVDEEVTWTDPEEARLLVGSPVPLKNPTPLEDWLKLIHPDDHQRHGVEAAKVVQDGQGRVEFRIVTPAGQVRWFEASGQVVNRDGEGSPRCLRGITLDITGRKEAEQRLRESEQQFKTMADRVPNFVWFGDAQGNIHYLNQRWAEFTGQNIEEALGTGWTAMVHPDDGQGTLQLWQEAVARGQTYEAEMRYRRHDGEYRWYVARAEPLKDDAGQVTGWFGTSTDIHARRQAEEELRAESEALEILNRTGAAIASEIDLERVVQTVTDAGVELTGAQFGAFFYNVLNEAGERLMLYTLSGADRSDFEHFGMPRATAVFHPTFVGEGVVRANDILADARYGKNDPHNGMPKGHLPVRSYLAVPVASRSGEVIGGLFFGHPEPSRFTERQERLMVGIAAQAAVAIDNARLFRAAQHEIAARMRKEVELRESEDFSRSVVESSGDCIKVIELDGSLQFMNENGRCLMEVDDFSAICGQPWSSLWPKESAVNIEAAMQAARSGGIGRFTAFCPTAKGTPKWWDVIVTPVTGSEGKPVRLVSISRDITEQRRSEEARQLLLRELNHRVKNLFAIASGMVTMTARTAPSVEAMAKSLKGRLSALAKAHELIRSAITSEVEGADHVYLRPLIEAVIRPHLEADGDQLTLLGAELVLGVSSATSMALVTHELATNAAKYGALSTPAGKLAISWTVNAGQLELGWAEHIPDRVVEPPQKTGFGSTLASSSITGQLGGTIRFDWRPEGAHILLKVPLEQLQR